jgi:DNA-binding NarL/FixJ family response regulator
VTATDPERLSRQPGSGRQADGVDAALSAEEYQMAELIVAGYTDADLASLFSLTEATIHDRTARIFAKLGVSNKLELVLFAISYRVFV